nr:two-component regulator propeller domain-containing protein [uncultured Carboxylicivirga sp.]
MKQPKLIGVLCLLILLSHITTSYAEITNAATLKFNHLNNNDGLTDNTVYVTFQDNDGFIWFGTSHGLNRYDGYTITSYFSTHNTPHSLSGNRISALAQDNDNNLWIGTDNGIDVLDLETNQFITRINTTTQPKLPSDRIRFLHKDFKNQMWIGTDKGVVIYNCTTQSLQFLKQENRPQIKFNNYPPIQIAEDKNGHVWMSSNNGLYRYNNNNGILSFFHFKKKDELCLNNLKAMHLVGNHLWLGTKNGKFFSIDTNQPINLKKIKANSLIENKIIPISSISSYEDNLWIGTVGHGVFIYNLNNENKSQYIYDINNEESISWDVILNLFNDRNGSMWIGTYGKGCDIWHSTLRKFKTYKSSDKNSIDFESITSITTDYKNQIWISGYGRQNNLNIINQNNSKITRLNIGANTHFNVLERDIKSKGKTIWGCQKENDNQLVKFDIQKFAISETYTVFDTSLTALALTDDTLNNCLWIGTFDGIFCFDKKNHQSKKIENIQDSLGLDEPFKAYSIYTDNKDIIWIGSDIGLIKYNHNLKDCELIKLHDNNEHDRVLDIVKQRHFLWLASDKGLLQYNITSHEYKHMSEVDDLLSSMTVSIEMDYLGNLWIGSTSGILKFNPITQKITRFTKDDGLQSNDFTQGVKYIDPSGNLYFGGTNGFNIINPTELKYNILPPPVKVTKLFIHNKEVTFNPLSNKSQEINKSIEYCNQINLTSTDYVVSFEFSALNYVQSNKNQYAYILDGFENKWNLSGNRRYITYTNLPAGQYTLKVKASNNDGIWNEKGTQIKIIVHPPFYHTWWFKGLTVIFIVFSILIFYFARIKMLKNKEERLKILVKEKTASLHNANKKLEEQKEEILTQKELLEQKNEEILTQNEVLEDHRNHLEELVSLRTKELEVAKDKAEESDKLKTAFLANMSHEIRTPMNAIIGFSTLLRQADFTEEEKETFVDQIHTNGESLLHLIDDIIDLSKIESGQLNLIYKDFEVNAMMLVLLSNFRQESTRLHKNDIELELINDISKEFILNSDPYRLKQVLTNLLSNALKYTSAGKIQFGYHIYDTVIEFFVQDTGIGIDPKNFNSIFKRFNKGINEGSQLYGGTGLGLAISKQIVENIGGEMSVESEVGKGSRFSFTIQNK